MNVVENGKPYISGDELRIPYYPTREGRVDVYQVIDVGNQHEMTSWGVGFLPKSHCIAVKINQMHLKGDLLRLHVRVNGTEESGLRVNYREAQKISVGK